MDLLVAANTVPLAQADLTPPAGTPQYATDGNPGSTPPVPQTQFPAYHYNILMMELINIIKAGGLTPSAAEQNQVLTAIRALFPIPVPSGALTLYLSPTGSDGNSGVSESEALQTFMGAAATLAKYNLPGVTVTLNLAAGSYAGFNWNGGVSPCRGINIEGSGSGSTTIVGTGGSFGAENANCVGAYSGANIGVSGVKLTATGSAGDYDSGGVCLNAGLGGNITIGTDVVFGATGYAHIFCSAGGQCSSEGLGNNQGAGYTISGGGQFHIFCEIGGILTVADAPVIFSGTPAFSIAFIQGAYNGYIGYWNNTFTGSFSGTRYQLSAYSILNTNGASDTYLPGTGAGSASNSLYV